MGTVRLKKSFKLSIWFSCGVGWDENGKLTASGITRAQP